MATLCCGPFGSPAALASNDLPSTPAPPAAVTLRQDQSSNPLLPAKPNWLAECALTVKESYDDNVFLSGVEPRYLPASYIVPAGSAPALEGRSSWVTCVSPKIRLDAAPVLGVSDLSTLSVSYAPDFAVYHQTSSESYDLHRAVAAVKSKAGPISCSLDNTFGYIHGSTEGPTYPGAFLSAYGTATLRDHREQLQDRGTATLRYDWHQWFVRPTASAQYFDYRTQKQNVSGYQNYSDRYDVNGGADVGCQISPSLAATLGYRRGYQYQEQFDFTPYSSPSDYHRLLIGFEGKPWRCLDFKLQAGPDFRHYPADTAVHVTPVADKDPVKYYAEASIGFTPTKEDAFNIKYRQYQWVSTIGKVPLFDSTFDLSYRRKLTDTVSLDVGAQALDSDYTSGDLATCRRNDWQYTLSATLGWAASKHLALNAGYAAILGRNAQENLADAFLREYDRNVVSLGMTVCW